MGACKGEGVGPTVPSLVRDAVAPNSASASALAGRASVRGEMVGNIAIVRLRIFQTLGREGLPYNLPYKVQR